MANIPCYTCKDHFIQGKRSYLLDKKVNDVKELAKKDGYTGAYAIVAIDGSDGFTFVKSDERQPSQTVVQYLAFDKGTAL